MYKDFWDAAKDFGRTMLEYADYEYYKQLHDFYNDALENNGQFNLDGCRWPKFILQRKVDNLEAELKKRNVSLVEGSCKKALEEVNKIIETLKPNDRFPKVSKTSMLSVGTLSTVELRLKSTVAEIFRAIFPRRKSKKYTTVMLLRLMRSSAWFRGRGMTNIRSIWSSW